MGVYLAVDTSNYGGGGGAWIVVVEEDGFQWICDCGPSDSKLAQHKAETIAACLNFIGGDELATLLKMKNRSSW